jgi:WD40 repeat protein
MHSPRNTAFAFVMAQAFWLGISPVATLGQELVQAPADCVLYELSNLRVEKGVVADQIAFDYRRTREGKGQARLAARTDEGPINISGFGSDIEATGTIRLEDRFARMRSVLNQGRDDFGVEFYFESRDDSTPRRENLLVSNSVTYGTMNTRVQARPPTAEEMAAIDFERKLKFPPATVPAGYVRADESTVLVPGAPVLCGFAGEWFPAKFVSSPHASMVKVLRDGEKRLFLLRRDGWLAISEQTVRDIRTNPEKFSIDIRTLPGGDLLLDDDVQAVTKAVPSGPLSLPAGTPLMLEKASQWADVFFLGSDNVTARVLFTKFSVQTEERVSVNALAIRQRTLDDLGSDAARLAFAENVANYNPLPTASPTVASHPAVRPRNGTMADSVPFPTSIDESRSATSDVRVWRDQSGKFSITASLERKTASDVTLKRPDGGTVKVPLAKLSDADQAFLAQGEPSAEDPFMNVGATSSDALATTGYRQPFKAALGVNDLRWGAKSVAISPDNRFLLIGRAAESASMYDLKTGRLMIDSGRMPHMGNVTVCGFSPDGKHVLLGGTKGVVDVYQIDSKGKLKLSRQFAAHSKELTCLAFSKDGKYALTGGHDKQSLYWEIETGKELKALTSFEGKIKATCIGPSGNILMATDGETLRIVDLADSSHDKKIQVGLSHASGQAAAFSPNGLLLAVGDSYHFRLWNLQVESEMPKVEGNEIGWSAVFAPDSRHLIVGGNGVIHVWDTMTQTKVQAFPVSNSFYIHAVNINADGSLVVCPSGHDAVGVYQANP